MQNYAGNSREPVYIANYSNCIPFCKLLLIKLLQLCVFQKVYICGFRIYMALLL